MRQNPKEKVATNHIWHFAQ